VDVDGILRGKILVKSKFLSTLEDGFGMYFKPLRLDNFEIQLTRFIL